MAVEMAIWRMTEDGPHPLVSSPLDSEQRLEDMVAEDPRMSGTDLLIIGRQVPTGFGGFIDLLALDAEGRVHVLELKRDRTPRDVVAQALDYGSWAKDLSLEELEQIYQDNGEGDTHLDEAFAEHFGGPLPDVVNAEQQFTIVASELDATSDRIIEFLAESYDVPINAVFFGHFGRRPRVPGSDVATRSPPGRGQGGSTVAPQASPVERPGLLRDPRSGRAGRSPLADRPQVRLPQRGRRIVVLEAAAQPRTGTSGVRLCERSRLRGHRPSHRQGDPRTRRRRRNRRSTSTAPRSARCERGVEAGRSLRRDITSNGDRLISLGARWEAVLVVCGV